MKHYSDEIILRAIELYLSGKSMHECAAEIGCSRPTIHRWKNQSGVLEDITKSAED